MTIKLTATIVATVLIVSCTEQNKTIATDDLIGVWSGLLFQTEPTFESLILTPYRGPTQATLKWKNGQSETFPIKREGTQLSFKGSTLRFDGIEENSHKTLSGIITHNQWVQSLDFNKANDQWVATIPKPEIIDTDYFVYLQFFYDATGKLQAKIQSNKENRTAHFIIEEVTVKGDLISFKISNDRFHISAVFQPENQHLVLTYGNRGGTREVVLKRLDMEEQEGFLPRAPGEAYTYRKPTPGHGFEEAASLDEVGIDASLTQLMPAMNSGRYDHIHSIS